MITQVSFILANIFFLSISTEGRVKVDSFDLDEDVYAVEKEHSVTDCLSDVLQAFIGCKHVAPKI